MSFRRLPLSSFLAAAAAALVVAAAAFPAAAFPGCSDSTPAVSAPQALWEGLQPAAGKPFADTTVYNGHQLPNHNYPLWSALDVEDGVLFASYTGGFTLYTLGDPNNPKKAGVADLRTAAFLKPVTWFSELRDFIYFVDAPRGRSDVAVVAGLQQAGLSVFDTTSKTNPVARYQDSGGQETGKNFTGLYTAAVGNRLYAFAGVGTNGPGLYAYDLNAALKSNGCSENSFRGTTCAGVLQGAIDQSPVAYVAGIDLGGGRHLIATSGTNAAPGVKVWEIVPSASFGYQATLRVNASGSAHGIAVWPQGSKTYLAVRTTSAAQIYDISSCMGGSCNSLSGKEVGSALQLGFISGWQSVTFSRAGNRDSGTPFLYFGNDGKCHGMTAEGDTIPGDDGRKKEWLFDVSNPASPVEIAGNKTLPVDGGKKPVVDYWSFSYARNPSGFSQVMPRMGKFSGDHFYRAAWTIMEAHQRVNLDPSLGLFGPIDGYPGTAQTFTASASNCTPTTTWQWSAGPDATITGSGSTVQIAWSTLGPKVVTATNAGCGNAVAEHALTIHDPEPKIGSVTVSPASATVCQPITFKANDVTGQPTLSYSWQVAPAVTGLQQNGDSATWTPGQDDDGAYEASVTVSGPGGSAVGSVDIQVSGLEPLPSAGFAITNEPFTGSKVTFDAAVPGATEWSWDFGTGQFGPFTADPVDGPRPEHTFSCNEAVCTFDVRVQVRNCEVTTPVVSATLQVVIDNPLEVRSFSPICSLGICGFSTGENILFAVDASGDPDQYQVDWEGKGSFAAAAPTTCPAGIAGTCVGHAYAVAGTYTPVVKIVRDGQASDPVTSSKSVTVVKPTNTPPPPPPPPTKSISVSGPTSGNVGQALTYSASASGCTASANGWTWNTGGGSGSSNTSSITITFATAGSRTVTATNSGCSGVQGSRTVNIGVNQSALAASYTFAPALPKVGETVKFDAGSSAGAPEFYYWKIGDQLIPGKTLEYVFTAPGSHSVTLEVSKQDKSCSLGMCSASTTKTVVVQEEVVEQPPPVLGNGCAGADAENPSLLCLLDGRFRVRVNWINQHAGGQSGVGQSVRSAATGDTTGFFWFFNADNIELLVKMLDGTTVNGHYWFFHGGLSDVFYEITVEDTVAGTSRTYTKLENTIGGGSDAAAFPAIAGAATAASTAAPQRLTGALHQGTGGGGGGGGGGEAESSDHLLLLDGRFEVTVDFLNQHAGDAAGSGRALAGTNNAGYFWFFTQDNLELVVKMIDARPFDGHFWVFWTGLSDLKYNIEVKDTETGEVWEFHNPAGKVGGGADTSAFGG